MPFSDPASRAYARTTGALYLVIAVAGFFAILYVPGRLTVPGDPAATADNIRAMRGLFHAGLVADVVMMLAEILVSAMLYFMFRPVNATLSLAAAFARLMMVAVMAAMLFFHAGAVALIDGRVPLDGFSADQVAQLSGLMRHMHDAGVWIWQIFFCVHLVLLGVLVLRASRVPWIFGPALAVGGLGYLCDTVRAFAFPDAALLGIVTVGLLLVVTAAELGFALWLLIRAPAARA